MEINVIGLISAAILGSAVGRGIAFFIFRFKKVRDKKNILKDIENQEDKIFGIPEMVDGNEEQNVVDLKVLAGLKEPDEEEEEDYDDEEVEEEEEEEDYDDEEVEEELDEDYNKYVSKKKN